jgi:hypothetical protein
MATVGFSAVNYRRISDAHCCIHLAVKIFTCCRNDRPRGVQLYLCTLWAGRSKLYSKLSTLNTLVVKRGVSDRLSICEVHT